MTSREEQINQLKKDWSNNPRWKGVLRSYNAEEVVRLRPSLLPEYTIAQHTAKKFWAMLHGSESVFSLGCMTGNQAIQCVQAGLKAIYCSGW